MVWGRENFQKEYNPGKFCCIKLGEEIIKEGKGGRMRRRMVRGKRNGEEMNVREIY